jgi:hypothetical protein
MKSVMLVIVLLASANILYAQKDADEVAKAVETLKQAMIDANKKVLENIAADNLTYGHSSGLVEDKAAFVDALVSGRSDFVTITLSEQSILVTGNTATVRHKHTGDVVNSGTPGKVNISVLLVWIKVKNDWKLLARQAVKI